MNRKIFLFIFLILTGAVLIFLNRPLPSKAGTEHNVSGWAWSENIGWISFNSSNCDTDGNGRSDGSTGCPPSGTTISNYGVSVVTSADNSVTFSGYAWSENIGWIKFDPAGPYPGSPNHSDYSAKIESGTTTVTGWARACAGAADNINCSGGTNPNSGGWDGWISLSGSNYKVELKKDTDGGCYLDGYAWGSDVVGWIRFSGDTYRVKVPCLTTTTTTTLEPPNITVNDPDYCTNPFGYTFTWNQVSEDASYDIKICTDEAGSTCLVPETNIENSTSYTINTHGFNYGTKYYVFVRAKNADTTSEWSSKSFETISHPYPKVDFTWDEGKDIVIGEEVGFINKSECYTSNCTYKWSFVNGEETLSSTDENPKIVFQKVPSGNKITVTLEVTDSDPERHSCTLSKQINVKPKWPTWVEVKPF